MVVATLYAGARHCVPPKSGLAGAADAAGEGRGAARAWEALLSVTGGTEGILCAISADAKVGVPDRAWPADTFVTGGIRRKSNRAGGAELGVADGSEGAWGLWAAGVVVALGASSEWCRVSCDTRCCSHERRPDNPPPSMHCQSGQAAARYVGGAVAWVPARCPANSLAAHQVCTRRRSARCCSRRSQPTCTCSWSCR